MEYFNLGTYRREISHTSADAELWFNRGLLWSYSFNHGEAVKCFRKAVEYDSECSMAYWGIAYALGPNYNKTWSRYDSKDLEETVREAQAALQLGLQARTIQPLEKALIEAISTRFPRMGETSEDWSSFDQAYVRSMRGVLNEYSSDMDVAVLFADAVMCVRPRQLWDLDTGEATGPDIIEAMKVLEARLNDQDGRNHPGICHFYIHMMEMAPNPEKARLAADRLRHLVPDGSHMQHMSTHIDIACGDYFRAIDSNWNAVISDDKFFSRETPSTMYAAYRSHNIHVLIYAAMMAGRSQDAYLAAKRIPDILTSELLSIKSPPMADWTEYQVAMPVHVLIRFGRWTDILQLEVPRNQDLYITVAMIKYAQCLAFSALGRVSEAEKAKVEFQEARRAIPENRQYGIAGRADTVLEVASCMLDGELEYRKGNLGTAFALLRKGVHLEDQLPYADPPVWMQPVRHALGALLVEQGYLDEAEEVYKQDLGLSKKLPRRKARLNNVWSLHGLHECFHGNNKFEEAERTRLQRDIAVASADISLKASCFCRLVAMRK
ncbi:hypothetical protein HJFPF1_05838 [Paramyrothecium foliicola]|nr:hypothetical protein HJFPF1_05838 [Paramyrothecium foliicola]